MIELGEMDRIDRKYFLDYQIEDIMDETRLCLEEKSIRIGITFARAMRAVRRRMLGKGNYLHTSVNERVAKSFALDCKKFCKIYDAVGASDIKETDIWNESENRRETALEIEFKRQKCSIKIFSSNPDAIRGEGGEVGIDEICSHKRPADMIQAAGGRAMWGFPLAIWSSHKGINSEFNRKIKEERALGDKSRWKIKTLTLFDALDQGLLEKINAVSGENINRDDFIADTKAMVGGEDAFAEECLCQPRASGSQAIKWQYIDAAKRSYYLLRKHLEGDEAFDIKNWIAPLILPLRAMKKCALGYDVARTGHLSAVPVLGHDGAAWKNLGLLTMHKRSFRLQFEAVAAIMQAVPSMIGGGDATGLGMQTCEDLTKLFGEQRFVGINFSSSKREIGTQGIKVFEDGRIHLSDAREHEDIPFDLAAIQVDAPAIGVARFIETANPVNKISHCDIAWAILMALMVGEQDMAWGYA
jgi:phage FluMu gp28-like protein